MSTLQPLIVLFLLMNLIMIIHAASDNIVPLYNLINCYGSVSRVSAADVDRVNHFKKIGEENDVETLKDRINSRHEDRKINKSEFLDIIGSLASIKPNVDIASFAKGGKSYFTKEELMELLGIDDEQYLLKLDGLPQININALAGIIRTSFWSRY